MPNLMSLKEYDLGKPWTIVDGIINELFPFDKAKESRRHINGVSFDFINTGHYYSYFAGLNITIRDSYYRITRKAVKMDKNGNIDLDKVMVKYNELLVLSDEIKQREIEKKAKDDIENSKRKIVEDMFKDLGVNVIKLRDSETYRITVQGLTPVQCENLAEFLRMMKK